MDEVRATLKSIQAPVAITRYNDSPTVNDSAFFLDPFAALLLLGSSDGGAVAWRLRWALLVSYIKSVCLYQEDFPMGSGETSLPLILLDRWCRQGTRVSDGFRFIPYEYPNTVNFVLTLTSLLFDSM